LPQVAIEYVILVPILILQIFLFPIAAAAIMNVWIDSRRTLALEENASHLGSSIQQLYFSLNHTSIAEGNVTSKLGIPPFIEGYAYSGNATLRSASEDSIKILDLSLRYRGLDISTATSVQLGQNVAWIESVFMSNSTDARMIAQKLSNGTIQLSFGS
jgi:hypothetical protein